MRLVLFFILATAGSIGLAVKYIDGGFERMLPGLAFAIFLAVALYRPYNWLLHFGVLILPARGWALRIHPAWWDRVCPLPYPGLEYILGRFALEDKASGTRAFRRVSKHGPLRRAAARAEQAVYVALGAS